MVGITEDNIVVVDDLLRGIDRVPVAMLDNDGLLFDVRAPSGSSWTSALEYLTTSSRSASLVESMADYDALEASIREHFVAGDFSLACTAAIEGYGPEILSYLLAVLRNEADATEVFSDFWETVWKNLASFEWRSTFRTWAYTLVRHAVYRLQASPAQRPEHHLPLSEVPEMIEMAIRVRTRTLPWLRTEVKEGIVRLREQLTTEEQTLLILRVDRGMSWLEIASITGEGLSDDEVLQKTEIARVRKQFQRLKDKLKALAREGKLISELDP
jgi:RNA polymerase sigma-70 factor, ECF subfamily